MAQHGLTASVGELFLFCGSSKQVREVVHKVDVLVVNVRWVWEFNCWLQGLLLSAGGLCGLKVGGRLAGWFAVGGLCGLLLLAVAVGWLAGYQAGWW